MALYHIKTHFCSVYIYIVLEVQWASLHPCFKATVSKFIVSHHLITANLMGAGSSILLIFN